jgi:hypothetical protein
MFLDCLAPAQLLRDTMSLLLGVDSTIKNTDAALKVDRGETRSCDNILLSSIQRQTTTGR